MRRLRPAAVALIGILLGSCGWVVEPAGVGARRISGVWWLMFWLGLIPLVIVVVLILGVTRRRTSASRLRDQHFVVGGVVLSAVLLVPVIVATADAQLDLGVGGADRVGVEVTGHQFWWEIEYEMSDGEVVRTANELHIPVGIPVDLRLGSSDVIHSVWVPELHGKMDLIPGKVNELVIQADEPGVYEGRCAEFCGLSHARMKFLVIASPEDEFAEWLSSEAAPAEVEVETGTRQAFANSCAPCHTVRGLFGDPTFEGTFGPDLTHLASRRRIGANLLPNTPEGLARWIVDPQGVKPGNRMPDVGLDADALNSILELLEQLD